jgi:putative transcriptional regulator
MSIAGESIIKGVLEALAFTQSKENDCVAHVPNDIDVYEIRSNMHMTQKQFSDQFGFSEKMLLEWEQGRRSPAGASRVLLQVLAKEPDAVIRALQA